ncbi:MAG: glycoside hydrolase family 2 TIM barrel-domain containing protein [Luteolibacter sp.]|uniref:glycoside hydrolase family 2 protein n=1 Tax=Luteolibacter sp. TaxID=1962973 RepID=UPI0032650734
MNRRFSLVILATGILLMGIHPAAAAETEVRYLSGHGPKDAVPWDFSVTGGRRAGEKTTIPVPSNWEQQGFGSYNYGDSPGGKADEHGIYKTHFTVPENWKGRRIRIVFDGVMTDVEVKVNGKSAGPVHQGGFYRFRYDITKLLNQGGENLLEVDVAKRSSDPLTERAERNGDYWVFGGIFRPVFLEAVPDRSIEQVSVNATADGVFKANVDFGNLRESAVLEARIQDAAGNPVGEVFSAEIPGGGCSRVSLETKIPNPALWTAETPNLYTVKLALKRDNWNMHEVTQRFGFRTIEVRKGGGFFLNGKRILLKGVCRHSFRPETGRCLDPETSYEDVRLLKSMNMNAVRMSHYPPDVAFLEACDELGLYVLDELSGWQNSHGTEIGRKLIREMATRDVSHPSILFWDNGNEGGWNRELDGDFRLYDPQDRIVLHPWEPFNGIDTKHYPSFADLTKRLAGPNTVMPTEMIHGLYDGGAGAGLEDYWKAITTSPFGGGGFIWVLADEGIMRTDQGNRIDVFSTYAPDGIVGPHHEKKGSCYTVRDVFSPVQIDRPALDKSFTGKLKLRNRYDFVSLAGCRFEWKLLRFPDPAASATEPNVIASGKQPAPEIAAGADGSLDLSLPADWGKSDALSLTATDATGRDLWTWTWPTPSLGARLTGPSRASGKTSVENSGSVISLRAGNLIASFDVKTGLLKTLSQGGKTSSLANGPRVVFARPAKGDIAWTDARFDPPAKPGAPIVWKPETPLTLNLLEIELDLGKNINWAGFKLEISLDGQSWKTLYDGTRRSSDGKTYEFPPQTVAAVRLSNFRQVDGNLPAVKKMRVAYQAERFPAMAAPAKVTSGPDWVNAEAEDGSVKFRWTLSEGEGLRLDYSYKLDGDVTYHGITFDHPEDKFQSVKWLGEGPSRVWQNRLRGTTLGTYEIAKNDIQPGESWTFPEFQGCFAGLRWARLATETGDLTVTARDAETYLRVGTPRISHPFTTVAFPAGDLSFLKAIPAIGSKFLTPENSGPSGMPAKVSGEQTGSLVFRFGD